MIHQTAIIHKNVELGKNVSIGPFCIIGCPPGGAEDGELKTIIGDNAVIRSHTVIYAGNEIGPDFSTGHHVVIRENNTIGHKVSVGTQSCIEHHIQIAEGVRIHSQVFIPEFSRLLARSWIGPNVVVTNAKYPRSRNVKENLKGIVLGAEAKIGANATILPGIEIGERALIGAGSVVVAKVEPEAVIVGNPGRKIRDLKSIDEYKVV